MKKTNKKKSECKPLIAVRRPLLTDRRAQKTGQINQTFIYIMAIIVIGAIVLIGYNAIDGIIKDQCKVEQTRFEKIITEKINDNRNQGNAETAEIKVPCDYEEICFAGENIQNPDNIEDQTIRSEVKAQTGYKVFLKGPRGTIPIMQTEGLQVQNQNNYVCIKGQSGLFYIKMESLGYNKVQISSTN